jgi:hypothetical protein
MDESLDPARLTGIADDLKNHRDNFKAQAKLAANGKPVYKSVGDVEECSRLLRKHRTLLRKFNDSTREDCSGKTAIKEPRTSSDSDDETDCCAPEADRIDACSSPTEIRFIQAILSTYRYMSSGRQTLATPKYESFLTKFSECRKCMQLYVDEIQTVAGLIDELGEAAGKYDTRTLSGIVAIIKSGGK